jgi:hypothetical protein
MTEPMQETYVAKSYLTSVVREEARAEFQKLADNVWAPAVGESIGRLIAEAAQVLEARCAALEAKIARLEEAAKEPRYKGVWVPDQTYTRGDFCTLGGIWHCDVVTTRMRPGTDASWTLALPKPRDGRDGKDAAPSEPPERRSVRSQR